MIIFPNCKINLGLFVTDKRTDGFHNIETVMYPINLFDALEIIPTNNTFQFQTSGINLSGDPEQNLVVKAYHLIKQKYGIGPVHIHLHKAIPAGAGLGGGSSDAAHTILLLNEVFSLGLSIDSMENYARILGSDCAFFIQNKPVLASQKGDHFSPLKVDLTPYKILIVKPELNINTNLAYSWIKPSRKSISIKEIIQYPIQKWDGKLVNDFEQAVFDKHPELAKIKAGIRNLGAIYTSMTGSGAAIFGIFKTNDITLNDVKFPGNFVWLSQSHSLTPWTIEL